MEIVSWFVKDFNTLEGVIVNYPKVLKDNISKYWNAISAAWDVGDDGKEEWERAIRWLRKELIRFTDMIDKEAKKVVWAR